MGGASSLEGSSLVADAERRRALLFGGMWLDYACVTGHIEIQPQFTSHLQEYVTEPVPAWRVLDAIGGGPGPRAYCAAAVDAVRDRFVVTGGRSYATNSTSTSDIWTLDLVGAGGWTLHSASGPGPAISEESRAVHDPIRDRMLVFSSDGSLRALALSDSMVWSVLLPPGQPFTRRYGAGLVLDPAADRLLLHGGSNYGPGPWSIPLSGATAPELLTPGGEFSPMPRGWHAMAIDPTTPHILLVGGDETDEVWHLEHDLPTATLVTRRRAEARADHVSLEWQCDRLLEQAHVRKGREGAPPEPFAQIPIPGDGRVELIDREVEPGSSYRYELRSGPSGRTRHDVVELRVPGRLESTALRLALPSPVSLGANAALELPSAEDVRFTVFDAGGRAVLSWRRSDLPAGRHAIALEPLAPLPPALYWLVATTPSRSARARFVVIR